MSKLDWRRAKTYRAEREPTGGDPAQWVRDVKLTCRACNHQGKTHARLPARFVCSRCGSHRVKVMLLAP